MQLNTEKAAADRLRAENVTGRTELEKVREELANARVGLEEAQQEAVSAEGRKCNKTCRKSQHFRLGTEYLLMRPTGCATMHD